MGILSKSSGMLSTQAISLVILLSLIVVSNASNFLHLSDMHLDQTFAVGSDPLQDCHRGRGAAGRYGIRAICDAPFELLASISKFVSTVPNVEFVIWTGDNSRHDADPLMPRTQETIWDNNLKVANMLSMVFPPSLPIVPSIGNNDVYPHDQLSEGPNPTLTNLSGTWRRWIPPEQMSTFLHLGCFSKVVHPNLLAISLNTIFFYKKNNEASCSGKGHVGDLAMDWLKAQLTSAAATGKQVYITGHVPPDPTFWKAKCLELYEELSWTFQSTIAGHIYGHTHQDNFIMLNRPSSNEPSAVINIGPSGLASYNPSARVFSFDNSTAKIIDYSQYYANVTEANARGMINFEKLYSWKAAYGYSRWSLDSWVDLSRRITIDTATRERYITYRYVNSGLTQFQCSEEALVRGTCVIHADKYHNSPLN